MGGARCRVVQAGGALGGERLGDIRAGQVITGFVRGGEQRVEIRIRAVGGQAEGPAVAAAAFEQGGFGQITGPDVETAQTGRVGTLVRTRRNWIRTRCLRRNGVPALRRYSRSCGLLLRQAGMGLAGPGQRELLESTTSMTLERGRRATRLRGGESER
jgi:hypothetical protein